MLGDGNLPSAISNMLCEECICDYMPLAHEVRSTNVRSAKDPDNSIDSMSSKM